LQVHDPIKGGSNIAIRVDASTAAKLRADMEAEGWATRSQYASMMLSELLDAYRAGTASVNEIRVWGRRRGPNAPERDAMWQAHDPSVVQAIKLLETSTGLKRHVIGRAAVTLRLARCAGVQP
jgi:hypothetical protein